MFDDNGSLLNPIEFIVIERPKFLTKLGISNGDLIFHFLQVEPIGWPKEIDELFKEVFQGGIKDLTGELQLRMKETIARKKREDKIPPTFMMDIYNEVNSDPSKIHKQFNSMVNCWSYIVRQVNSPYIDLLVKKIIDGIDAIV
jgi:hypothetical protein